MIVARVRRTLVERQLLSPGARVLVACSGGPDSAALLAALAQLAEPLRLTLTAASVDHGLRPDAAADVAVAARQAEQLGIEFHGLRVQVPAGVSIQARAREVRYAALLQLGAELGVHGVAVGHTRDDQAETVVMRLLRGAGVKGLSGIEPRRADGVVRPLIDCSRAEVQRFAARRFTELADDPGNQDPRFERVRIRGRVLPALLREDPALIEHLADLADDARALTARLPGEAESLLEQAAQQDETIALSTLRQADPPVRRWALRHWLETHTGRLPARTHLEQLDRDLAPGAEVWLPDGWVARVDDRGLLRLDRRSAASTH